MACESRIINSIRELVVVFYEYAAKDSQGQKKGCGKDASMDQFRLSKREFKELVQKELNIDDAKDPGKIDELMKELDTDGDGQLDFTEFVGLVTVMACAFAFLELLN